MKVVELKKKGSIVNILFDNSELLKIPYELFVKNNLYIDDEISNEQFQNLTYKAQLYNVKQNAFRYLALRNHSKNELKLKLLKKGYDKYLISSALNEIEVSGFINDENFAENYFNFQMKRKKGLLKIKAELFRKGIDRNTVELVANKFVENPEFESSIIQLAEKKLEFLKKKKYSKIQIKQKMYAYLIQRGFKSDLVQKTLSKKLKDIDE